MLDSKKKSPSDKKNSLVNKRPSTFSLLKNNSKMASNKPTMMNTNMTSSGNTKKNLSAREEENPYLVTGKRSSLYAGTVIKNP